MKIFDLLDLLNAAWPIIAIIFFAILSAFTKGAKGRNRMPDFGGGGGNVLPVPGHGQEPQQKPVTAPVIKQTAPPTKIDFEHPKPKPKSPFSNTITEKPKEQVQQIKPAQNELVQGMIWAEILGPPRAKKPLRK